MIQNFTRYACLLAALCCAVLGQNTAGTGRITGVITDPTGSAVPGAIVLVENQSKGIRRELKTTDGGLFSAPSLVPAAGYQVSVNAPGFAPYQVTNISVAVGQNVSLTPKLSVNTSTTTVEVTTEAPIVDSTRSDVSQVIGTQQIQDLPINGRRVDSFVLLAPAVVSDGTFGLLSFRGIAGGNAFLTDGNDTTEQYYNENAGRTRIQSQISQDAVQEFQVVSNNYSAEFGHAMGGVVNTVTRSGSNDFHGTAYWFFRNQDFNARDPFARINPTERRDQFGASVGGKIIKDKLFYFFNYEGTRRDFPLIANISAAGSSLFNTAGQLIAPCPDPAASVRATAAQCDAARNFLNRHFLTVPRTVNQNLGFGKLDWRPTDRSSFSVDLNVLRWVSPNGLQTQAVISNGQGVGNNVNSSVRSKYGRAAWTYIISPTILNEARFGWFNDKQFDYPNDALAIPGIGFLGINITGQSNLGTATDYPRTNPLENRYQGSDTLSWTTGKHSLRIGGDILDTEDYTNLLFNRTGTYLYSTFNNLALDLSGNTNGRHWQTFTQTIGNPAVDFHIRDYDFFVQDQYKIVPRLTLNLGLRYDFSSLPQPTTVNPDYPATGRIPTFNSAFAPRVGFAYAFDSASKTVLRGGYGIFYARYPGGLINTFFLGNGLYQKAITFSSPTTGPAFPAPIPNSANFNPGAGTVSLTMPGSDFRAPYTQQADLAIERQLTKDLALTVSGIWSRGLHLTSVNDINAVAGPVINYRILDAGRNQVGTYSTPVYLFDSRADKRYFRINIVDAGLNSWYNGLAVQLNKRFSHGLSGNIAYTWSHAIDEGQGSAGTPNIFASGGPQSYFPGNYRAEKGSSVLDVRHRLVINGVWSPTFLHNSSGFARYLVNGWQLSVLGTFQSSPAVTPTVQITSAPTPGNARVYSTGSLNGYTSGGLGNRVPFLPIGSLNVDQIIRVDARIARQFAITERFRAMFTFDAFNIGNNTYFTSVSSTAYTYSATGGPSLIPAAGYGVGTATQGFPDGTNARRLQLGVRLLW
ncbi:MAG: carboxypeptidase regulatory-like domain-containing protein [Bryobacteraceae bacterium]